jgi:uncharacterized protein YbbC (DUF1343 family)
MSVKTGLEVLLSDGAAHLRGKRVGLICNQASVGPGFEHVVDALARQPMVRIGALLGPEHGVRGEAQDMIPVAGGGVGGALDRRTAAPVHSLYGDSFESLSPTPEMLEGLDALVFDMQDVGARYYTFYATMVLAMKKAADAGLEFIVLDRPNPLGGEAIEGGVQEEGFLSFVGLFPLPVRHGMTVGELAVYANDVLDIDCNLSVVRMDGWKRAMQWEETGLPFIPPSPNMPTPDTARVYPGMCLVEGTNLSEGRGTTRPFELAGAPFYDDPDALADALNRQRLPGVHFRPAYFLPMFQKFARQGCGGIFMHVTDRNTFLPYRSGLAFCMVAQDFARRAFRWRTERYEFVDTIPAFDLLTGTAAVREAFNRGEGLGYLLDAWAEQEQEFRVRRAPYLLYE